MTWTAPAAWWLLAAVAAVAAWAMFRPGRVLVPVGTLGLWEQAAAALPPAQRRRLRHLSISWLLLLAGALSAVAALAGPVRFSHASRRSVSLAVCPSAELSGPGGMAALRQRADDFLGQLTEDDRVELLLPTAADGGVRRGWLSPAQAWRELEPVTALPAARGDLSFPSASEGLQGTWFVGVLGDAEVPPVSSPGANWLGVASSLPAATFDALGAAVRADGKVELFAAGRNHTDRPWVGRLVVRPAADGPVIAAIEATIAPNARQRWVLNLPAGDAFVADLIPTGDERQPAGFGAVAAVARRAGRIRLALIGTDEPLIRRLIRADDRLELAAGPEDADVVVANRADAPADKPVLAILPLKPPPGFRAAEPVGPIVLADASLAADDPVLRGVDLRGVAVRAAAPWRRSPAPPADADVTLVSLGGQAILTRCGDSASGPRRVRVGFDLSLDNTNLGASDAFVVLIGNAIRWLADAPAGGGEFTCVRPIDAPGLAGRAGLPAPGLYRDAQGNPVAVSLLALESSSPPAVADTQVELPSPAPGAVTRDYRWLLVLLAMALWLAGWFTRGLGRV